MNGLKAPVKVMAEAEGKLAIETRDGAEKAYCLNPERTMYLHVRQLQVSSEVNLFRFSEDDLGLAGETSLCVRGTATLQDGAISVIGDPDNVVRTLAIDFYALDEIQRRKRKALAQQRGAASHDAAARVGFLRHSPGTGLDDDWFVLCQILPATLRAISSAVSDGTMGAMSVGLALRGIYCRGASASPSAAVDWFLRPNHRDNTVNAPDMAHGDITLLSFEQAQVDSSPEAVPQLYAFDDTIPAALAG